MRASQWFMPTLKEIPSDAEITSHQLMIRAGMIRKLGSGLYTWLPTGLKILKKIETIIREELNAIGALELLMPAVQPAELWHETERWDTFGGQLLKMKDSNDRSYCFGPTHEEVITDLIRQTMTSYKSLPLTLYQIQTKFRDEIRPRFGVMRAREFLMKDAYSFHLTNECLEQTYQLMFTAYERIFTRMGLSFRAVEADTGAIGGAVSHEFQVLAETGEDVLCCSTESSYAANIEQATSLRPSKQTQIQDKTALNPLFVKGIEAPVVALLLKASDTLNEVKAGKHPWIQTPLQYMDATLTADMPLLIDYHAEFNHTSTTKTMAYADLRQVKEGDPSPDGQGVLSFHRGIEVGHIFQLGSKYTTAMHATVTQEDGRPHALLMGCYGIGVSRLVAAAIEQHHDDRGICWPKPLAPFLIGIIPIFAHRQPHVMAYAETLYHDLKQQGYDVLLDDREERPGVLFADHDLIGIPYRIVISEKLLAAGQIEFKARDSDTAEHLAIETLYNQLNLAIGLNL